MPSTIYDIQIHYGLNDRASQGLSSIAAKADAAAKSTTGLKEALIGMGALWAGKRAFSLGKEMFIDLNSEMQQMKINMAALTGYNLALPFSEASKATDKLVEGWIRFSAQTSLTGSDMVKFGQAVSGSITSVGGTLKDVDELVRKGSVVYQVLSAGHPGGMQYAQLEFREAMMGNLRKTQMANMQLLTPVMSRMGLNVDQWNTLSGKTRMEIMRTAVNDPSWKEALKQMASSWEGVTTTLKTNIEIATRDIGLPLFQKMSEEVKKWNTWINQHPEKIKDFADKFSKALISGFNAVKSVGTFLAEHKDTLFMIAKMWVGSQITQGIMGTGASMLGTLSNFSMTLGDTTAVLRVFYVSLKALADELDMMHKEKVGRQSEYNAVAGYVNRARDEGITTFNNQGAGTHSDMVLGQIVETIHQWKAYTDQGQVDWEKFSSEIRSRGFDAKMAEALGPLVAEGFEKFNQDKSIIARLGLTPYGPDREDTAGKKIKIQPNINVTIHRIEATTSDPDRFVIGMVKKFHDVVRNPVAAESQIRGAF